MTHTIEARIPAGVKNGRAAELRGEGAPGNTAAHQVTFTSWCM